MNLLILEKQQNLNFLNKLKLKQIKTKTKKSTRLNLLFYPSQTEKSIKRINSQSNIKIKIRKKTIYK